MLKIVTVTRRSKLIITILAPVGKFISNDKASPARKQITDKKTDSTATALKLMTSLRAMTAGKIIRLDISKLPIILIPMTTVSAVRSAIRNW